MEHVHQVAGCDWPHDNAPFLIKTVLIEAYQPLAVDISLLGLLIDLLEFLLYLGR